MWVCDGVINYMIDFALITGGKHPFYEPFKVVPFYCSLIRIIDNEVKPCFSE